MMKRSVLLFVLALAVAMSTLSQQSTHPADRAEVLVLGTYHMANPGDQVSRELICNF
ncbi:MAG TPA: hypothetical protein VGQ55_03220 [Pyrinomonadaceae bacterium]|nr:hypothetical protein [Pyrinomonadaceae bacterium]